MGGDAIPTRLAPKVTSATPIGRFNDFVEMAREVSREEGRERSLSFDLDKGWHWGDAAWKRSVPPGADLKSLRASVRSAARRLREELSGLRHFGRIDGVRV